MSLFDVPLRTIGAVLAVRAALEAIGEQPAAIVLTTEDRAALYEDVSRHLTGAGVLLAEFHTFGGLPVAVDHGLRQSVVLTRRAIEDAAAAQVAWYETWLARRGGDWVGRHNKDAELQRRMERAQESAERSVTRGGATVTPD